MRWLLRWVLAGFFLCAGVAHWLRPHDYARIVPPPLPPLACVYLSGLAEIVGALLLPFWPRVGGWLLIATLVAVFPANVYMAVSGVKFGDWPSQPWMAWARLPLQFVFIALVWLCL